MKLPVGKIIHGDCLEVMPKLPDKSIDTIIADMPYGTTACKWDSIIPLEPLWKQIKRIIKPNGAIVLFANQPFTTILISSNIKMFKYCWIWDKIIPSGMGYAKYQPMRRHEDILIFSKEVISYYPQKTKRRETIKSGGQKNLCSEATGMDEYKKEGFHRTYQFKNPTTIISFKKIRRDSLHPTQKPVELLKYLIRTYTNKNDLVLDFVIGSGTTVIGCMQTDRRFIGIEKDKEICQTARKRILIEKQNPPLFKN